MLWTAHKLAIRRLNHDEGDPIIMTFYPDQKEITEVSTDVPWVHCGKPDWCYRFGELTACKRGAEPATGWEVTSKTDKEGTPYYAPAASKKAIRAKSRKEYFYPDRNGQPLIKVVRIFFMNMKLMFKGMDMGAWVGYPVDEYLRSRPRTGVSLQFFLTTYKRPPFYQIGTRWFSRRQVTIPYVDRRKLTYEIIRNACGGNQGLNWGEWVARAYLGLEDESRGLHQLVVGGSTEENVKKNLERFLPFTTCKLRGLTVNKIDYTKGDRANDPNKYAL